MIENGTIFPKARRTYRGFSEQSSTNEIVLSKILIIGGRFLLRKYSFLAVRKICGMFNNFCHERQVPQPLCWQ